MENNMLRAVFILNDTEGVTEFKVPAEGIEHGDGWVLALWNNKVVSGVKEEYLKAFYLEVNK